MLIDVTAAPDPSGRHDDLDGDDALAAELAFLVPDDPRSLDADRDAYFRELAGGRSVSRRVRRRSAEPDCPVR